MHGVLCVGVRDDQQVRVRRMCVCDFIVCGLRVGCVLSAVCCVLCAVCCVLCAVGCVLCAVCCGLCAVCCLLSAVCCGVVCGVMHGVLCGWVRDDQQLKRDVFARLYCVMCCCVLCGCFV
jgi:hypothetical protein